ncbi:MAG: 3D domain-containing protein [Sporomusaceae bacterium]|nr:3D domain-containing protein [Sporomusaceae bacterium]
MRNALVVLWVFLVLFVSSTVTFAAPGDTPLIRGMRGNDVHYAQKLLAETGYYTGEIDGVFGGMTLHAVVAFQRSVNLPANGVINRDTILYLQRAGTDISRYNRSIVMNATGYSAYDPGNGSYTSQGHLLRRGLVAVDPNVIPLGTRLYIPGYGFAVADDTGGSIKGNFIDLAFDSHGEALSFGRQIVTVYICD